MSNRSYFYDLPGTSIRTRDQLHGALTKLVKTFIATFKIQKGSLSRNIWSVETSTKNWQDWKVSIETAWALNLKELRTLHDLVEACFYA
jgi:hypothetical protein